MNNKPFIDYSQYTTYMKCEWYWVEKYLRQVAKQRPNKPKEDALTLGTLVHTALEGYRKNGTINITDEVIAKVEPSPECIAWANKLVTGYVQAYPQEEFTKYYCEDPIRFDLGAYSVDGLAKVDSYFHVDTPTTINGGLDGQSLTLNPGWWVHEYKTKAADRDRGNYILGWGMNMQAVFQMLALQYHINEPVQGVLVNVLEKPKEYIPRHTCKQCRGQYERRDWVPKEDGYECPVCGNRQKLDVSDKSKVARVPSYYRLMVGHTPEELEVGKQEIKRIGLRMNELRYNEYSHPLRSDVSEPAPPPIRRTSECVHEWFGPCEYYTPHREGREATGQMGFVAVDALGYVGETK